MCTEYGQMLKLKLARAEAYEKRAGVEYRWCVTAPTLRMNLFSANPR